MVIPAHQWTNGGDRVRILKVVDADRRSYQGFQWPESGRVAPDTWGNDATCESGGLFGWAWGIAFGDGKEPMFGDAKWIVFEALPRDVVDLGGKCKSREGNVIYCGDYQGAVGLIKPGQMAWAEQASQGAASATGYRSAASATGDRSAASATGDRSAASATGDGSAASVTGYSSAASATGDRSAASVTGYRSAASATGDRSAASATGYRSAASATGDRSAAILTVDNGTIEVGSAALGAVTSSRFWWKVKSGAIVCQRVGDGQLHVLSADALCLGNGVTVYVVNGVVQK